MTMQINLDELNPGTFFPFDEGDPNGGGVTLRVLTSGKLEEITNRCRKKRIEYKGNPPARFEVLDFKEGGEDKEFEMTWDYCIIDWIGLVDKEEVEIPCTVENKVALMRGSISFSSFVRKGIDKVNAMYAVHEKEKEKNLETT